MIGKKYEIRILPLFESDLNEIIDYITYQLKNPTAAGRLIADVEQAILRRSTCAEAFERYHSAKERRYPYYRIPVKNYSIFYVVIDDVMEVRRILYNKRNLQKLI